MTPPRFTLGSRLLAGFGTLALAAAVGLASSRPGQSAGGPVAVSVANTPLSTNAIDNPDKQAVQFTVIMEIANGNETSGSQSAYTAPAGKRLVIQTVSALSNSVGDTNHYSVVYSMTGGLGDTLGFGSLNLVPDGSSILRSAMTTQEYVDAGSFISIHMQRPGSTGSSSVVVTFTGHLVNIPGPGL